MRLAVVADIHGSLVALDAVAADLERRGVDRVLHAGDLALMGEARTVRVEYDVQRECALMAAAGHPDRERIAGMRWRGRYAPPG